MPKTGTRYSKYFEHICHYLPLLSPCTRLLVIPRDGISSRRAHRARSLASRPADFMEAAHLQDVPVLRTMKRGNLESIWCPHVMSLLRKASTLCCLKCRVQSPHKYRRFKRQWTLFLTVLINLRMILVIR